MTLNEFKANAKEKVVEGFWFYAVRFVAHGETAIQDGVLMHSFEDEFSDGDAVYGNGWTLDVINDADDVTNMLTNSYGDYTTAFWIDDDGVFHIDETGPEDADDEEIV